ncbi:hypothetical protein Tsubulata_013000 [Turnera subulata]|uniref:Uncharacterized protein n=1 Tax=Turnera subulata TaxID=218843 RepID=A0A9Q0FAD7_9ROSI|nr:hypothetical protein Tsubulata_013000 [Turnera subulata]
MQSGESHASLRSLLSLLVNPSSLLTFHDAGTGNVVTIWHNEDNEFTRLVEEVAITEVVELLRQAM